MIPNPILEGYSTPTAIRLYKSQFDASNYNFSLTLDLSTVIRFCKIQIIAVYMWSECYMIAVSIANKVLVTLNGFFGFLIFFFFFFFGLVGKKGALCFCSIILVLHLFLSSMYLLTISFLTFLFRFLKAIDRFNDLVVCYSWSYPLYLWMLYRWHKICVSIMRKS